MAAEAELLDVEGRKIRVTNPGKVFFPKPGLTKLDVARYFVEP